MGRKWAMFWAEESRFESIREGAKQGVRSPICQRAVGRPEGAAKNPKKQAVLRAFFGRGPVVNGGQKC